MDSRPLSPSGHLLSNTVGTNTMGAWTSPATANEPKGLVKFLVGSGQNQETLACDKRTLVASSPHFAKIVTRDMNSALPEWIILPDDNPKALQNILKYIEAGMLEAALPLDIVIQTIYLALKYQMPIAAKAFRNYLELAMRDKGTLDDAVNCLEASRQMRDEQLRKIALKLLLPYTTIILQIHSYILTPNFLARASHPDIYEQN